MIRRFLVPNRGEIAVRIARACRRWASSPYSLTRTDDVSPRARALLR